MNAPQPPPFVWNVFSKWYMTAERRRSSSAQQARDSCEDAEPLLMNYAEAGAIRAGAVHFRPKSGVKNRASHPSH
jgi:hypothetical protein